MLKPWLILLEVTNRCNSRCAYCNHKHLTEFCDMDFDFYKRIVVETSKYGSVLHPTGYGEPLLYPHIIEAISFANKNRFKTVMYTNASLLDETMAQLILDAGLNEIRISADGWNRESFESSRIPLSWNTVKTNIENFQKLKNKGGYKTLTMVRPTISRRHSSHRKDIIDFWAKRVDTVALVPECHWPNASELNKKPFSSGKPFRCTRVWQFLEVKANSNLVVCSCDYLGKYVIADLNETPVLEAFNNEAFINIREAMTTGLNYPTLCHNCRDARKI